MKILAVETSTVAGGAAVIDGERLIAEGRLNVKAIHSERLMSLVDFLLVSVKMTVAELDYLAVSVGPGSFTGLRVGLSTIKGLAFGADKMVVPVPTLKALAMNILFTEALICPLLDARKGEVYAAVYRNTEDKLETIISERTINVGELLPMINYRTVFIGEGAIVYRDIIARLMRGNSIIGSEAQMYPSPANVAFLAHKMALNGEFTAPEKVVPLYLRRSEAEINLSKCPIQ